MNITDIRIRKVYQDNKLKALVSVTIDEDLALHDIKVIQGATRLFAAMPSRKDETGVFRDVAHPITLEARQQLENSVLEKYNQWVEEEKQRVSETEKANKSQNTHQNIE